MLNPKIKERIIKNAILLEIYDINEFAWTKKDAQTLITSIIDDKIGILGGDVYELTANRLKPLSDSWSCNPNQTESEEEFYLRSKNESLIYINKFPIESGEQIIFAIVFTEWIE